MQTQSILKKACISAMVSGIVLLFSSAFSRADDDKNEQQFQRASDLDNYPGMTNLRSAQLVINLASVIHQENLQIIQALHHIEERLDKLEKQ